MDFGFGRFLEMFEERFGRRITTALLATMGLAVFGLSLALIYNDLIVPLSNTASAVFHSARLALPNEPPARPVDDILRAILAGVIAAGLYLLVVQRIHRRFDTEINRLIDAINGAGHDQIVDAVKATLADMVEAQDETSTATSQPDQPRSIPGPQGTPEGTSPQTSRA